MKFLSTLLGILGATVLLPAAAEPLPLRIGAHRDVEITGESGASNLLTTGENPHFWTSTIPAAATLATHPILSFEYFSTEPVPNLRVRVPRSQTPRTLTVGTLPLSETWRPFGIDLRLADQPYTVGERQHFALSFDTPPGHRFRIRNLQLRAPNADERLLAAGREETRRAREEDAAAYLAYLDTDFPAAIDGIELGPDRITIKGSLPEAGHGKFAFAELRSHEPSHRPLPRGAQLLQARPWKAGPFEIALPRFEGRRDRATSRWQLVSINPGAPPSALASARYPATVAPGVQRPLARATAPGIKGLGGIPSLTPGHEIFELGIHHATVNIVLNSLLSSTPKPGWRAWSFEGRPLHLNARRLDDLDQKIRTLTEHDIVVSAILLLANSRDQDGKPALPMVHPEALASGKFAMPDLATPAGAELYRAGVHLLTERYTRADAAHGRIANWILHNEIDQSGTWTTMGEQPLARYLETCLRSARLVYHSARRFDPHARVFISLTHHWTKKSGGPQTYIVRDLLELFARAARIEGDFEWGVAYHPYPRSLFEPRTWQDEVTFDFDTAYITPRNIEVLPAYLDQSRFHYRGQPRAILLSEQGINAPTLSPEDQRLQAAGIVYSFNRVRRLPAVEAYHYHAYRDNPVAEGGLLLGLTNPDAGHKFAWEIYTALDTPREAEASRFAWPIIGIPGPPK